MKTLEELVYEFGGLSGGTLERHIYDYFQKLLGDTIASYEIDRINLVDMTLERDELDEKYKEAVKDCRAWQSEYRAARALVERLKSMNDWISVEDRLPDHPGFYAVHKGTQPRIIGLYFDSDQRFRYADQDHTDSITHWRPLTQPPTYPF
jgi:hypothetical protein